jgi:putative lipoic acid-binding regulatory protein
LDTHASLELLESTHQFPCPYLFKAIGRVENEFVARVVAAVREETHSRMDPPYRLRNSAGGAHVAVTMEPYMESAQQVLDTYRRMRLVKGLVMLW